MSNDDHLLGTIMREARIKSHITQEDLAEKVHVNLTADISCPPFPFWY